MENKIIKNVTLVESTPDGPSLSQLVQGYWRLDDWSLNPQQRLGFLQHHVERGITTVDHADIYGDYRCETLFGEALQLKPSIRESIQVVSKCDIMLKSAAFPERQTKHYDTSAKHITHSVEQSLKRLRIEQLDVLLLHRPDPLMNADEVAQTLASLMQKGQVKHFGVSNFTPAQMQLLEDRLPGALVTNQVEINPLNPDVIFDGTLDYLQQQRIRPMGWSPLAGGRVFQARSNEVRRLKEALERISAELDSVGIDQLLLAWVLMLPSMPIPVLGSGKPERIDTAVKSLEIRLSREQWFEILEAATGQEVP